MTQSIEHHKRTSVMRLLRLVFYALLAGGVLALWMVEAKHAQTAPVTNTTTHPAVAAPTPCSTTIAGSAWTPTGVTWRLSVTFLSGSRQGQTEISLMTFAPDGSLTATFPGATPTDLPAQPPALSGTWCMTGINAFRYQFTEPIMGAGRTMVASVTTHIDAYLTSKTTYEAGGVGIAYAAATGQPLPGQYNVTRTRATSLRH